MKDIIIDPQTGLAYVYKEKPFCNLPKKKVKVVQVKRPGYNVVKKLYREG